MAPSPSLAAVLSQSDPSRPQWPAELVRSLDQGLAAATATAQNAWPDLELSAEAYVAHLARAARLGDDPAVALASRRHGELFLCAACLAQVPAALEALEREYLQPLQVTLRSLRVRASEAAEQLQQLRNELVVGSPGREPKLLSYRGEGKLAAWIKVIVTREALKQQRRDAKHTSDEVLMQRLTDDAADPELRVIKEQFRERCEAAVG